MFLFKRGLDRRTFLRGMGATVALPLLDAMIPARTLLAATHVRPVSRLAFVYFPHGAVMDAWAPTGRGGGLELGPILEPLEPFRHRLTVVSGLENRHAFGPVHAITPGTWLSGTSPRDREDLARGVTADQVAAEHFSRDTPLPWLGVAAEPPKRIGAGIWEGQFDPGYGATLSFRGAQAPVPLECCPRSVFRALFQRGATNHRHVGTWAASSVLDHIAAPAASLRRRLGPADRAVLGDYLESVRGVERRVQAIAPDVPSDSRAAAHDGPPATERADHVDQRLALMFDLVTLAFRADMTRVAAVMMAAETSSRTFEAIGVPEAFHGLSHHQNDPDRLDRLVRVQRFHTGMFAAFVRSLAALQEGDGSLLDRSVILYGSNMSDSHAHNHFPLPLAVVGGGCGTLRGGRHLSHPDRTPMANLLVTLLHRAGVPGASIGDSTGECADL